MKRLLLIVIMFILLIAPCFAMSDPDAADMIMQALKYNTNMIGNIIDGDQRILQVIALDGKVYIDLYPADEPSDSTYRVGIKLDIEGILNFLFYEPSFSYHVKSVRINYWESVDGTIESVFHITTTREKVYKYNVNRYQSYKDILSICQITGKRKWKYALLK